MVLHTGGSSSRLGTKYGSGISHKTPTRRTRWAAVLATYFNTCNPKCVTEKLATWHYLEMLYIDLDLSEGHTRERKTIT